MRVVWWVNYGIPCMIRNSTFFPLNKLATIKALEPTLATTTKGISPTTAG